MIVLDDHTWDCLTLIADSSVNGRRVARDVTTARRGQPLTVVSDNGTEFTGMAIQRWSQVRQIDRHNTAPCKPVQNGFIETFNGKLQAECLNLTGSAALRCPDQHTE